MDPTSWIQLIQTVGIPLTAVMLTVAVFHYEIIVPGTVYKKQLETQESCKKEIQDLKEENHLIQVQLEAWKEAAIRGTYAAQRATDVAEILNHAPTTSTP